MSGTPELPPRLRWVVNHVPPAVIRFGLTLIPDRLIGRVLPGSLRFEMSDIPRPLRATGGERRMLVAPVNWAGQGSEWARAAEEHLPGVTARSLAYRIGGEFGYHSDTVVPGGVYVASTSWHRAQKASVLESFTHVLVEAVRHPLGMVFGEPLHTQLRDLAARGIHVAMVCHGSEVRLPSRHLAHEPDSPFSDAASRDQIERTVSKNLQQLRALELPTFVSTPDLLQDVPFARWMPVVVDPALWAGGQAPLGRAVPVVVHAPSTASVKGTHLIEPMLHRLTDEGIIEYRPVKGVPHAELPALFRDADIVVDQFRIGSYGVAACEAMAAGRLVISHVNDQVRTAVHESTGQELPIVQARAAELEDTLRAVLDDRASYQAIAARGIGFVERVHSGAHSASVLQEFLHSCKTDAVITLGSIQDA